MNSYAPVASASRICRSSAMWTVCTQVAVYQVAEHKTAKRVLRLTRGPGG